MPNKDTPEIPPLGDLGDLGDLGALGGFGDGANLSDAELDAMMAGALPDAAEESSAGVEPGQRVRGTVIGARDGEVLLEFDQKTHGVIDAREFAEGELPVVGTSLQALVERYDRQRELVVLSVSETLKEIFWDDLTSGSVFEGTVTDVNKGGLTVDIKGTRAFLPISQIERHRVEDASIYVGQKLTVEVMSFDRENHDLVVSRRNILDRAADAERQEVITTLSEGQVLRGTVTRVNEHGAFVDLGGVDGLLHASKIRKQLSSAEAEDAIEPGKSVEVEIVHVDVERGRVGLELHRSAEGEWNLAMGDYEPGQQITGLITRVTDEAAFVLLEEGVEGKLPGAGSVKKGSLVRAEITAIDKGRREITLRAMS